MQCEGRAVDHSVASRDSRTSRVRLRRGTPVHTPVSRRHLSLISAMWRVLLFLLCLAAGSRQLSMTEFLVPAALEAGEDAELQCKYDLLKNESEISLFVKWWWTPLNNTDDERYPLYQRVTGQRPYLFHRHHRNIELLENDGLRLINVTPNVSGIYECEVSNIDEVRQRKKLVVYSIGSGPLLNVSVTEEEQTGALVTCEAFDIAPRPDIVITLNGKKVESSGYVTELKEGLYEVYKNATLPLDEADNGEFTCEFIFEDDNIPLAPYTVSQTFMAPQDGSNKIGDSSMLLTTICLLILLLLVHSE